MPPHILSPEPHPDPSPPPPATPAEIWSAAPAALVGLGAKGAIAAGKDADFVVWDPAAEVVVGGGGARGLAGPLLPSVLCPADTVSHLSLKPIELFHWHASNILQCQLTLLATCP